MPPVQQKVDLSAKKKRLEEMREREKQLAQELDLHMKKPLQQKSPVVKSKTGSTSGSGKITPRSKSTTSSSASTTKSSVKKKIDSKSTTPRRKKSKDKTLKQADSPKVPATENLLFLEQTEITREEIESISNNGPFIDFGESHNNNDSPSHSGNLSDTNPFSTNGLIDFEESQPTEYQEDLDFFGGGGEINPFSAPLGGDMLNTGVDEVRRSSSGLLNLQDDIIFEEEEQHKEEKPNKSKVKPKSKTKAKTKAKPATAASSAVEEAEEFYFPEDDNFPEDEKVFNGGDRGMYSDDFTENESESELFQEQSKKEFHENRQAQEQETFDEDEEEYEREERGDKGLRQQEFIRKEIQSDHFRELEVKRINSAAGHDDVTDDDDDVNMMMNDIRSKEDRSARSIQSLNEFYNDTEEESDADENNKSKQLSAAERIQLELLEQNQKERELKEIHRSLSRENIFYYDSEYEDTEDEALDDNEEESQNAGDGHETEERDTRSMILNEMEALKKREKELKKLRSYHEGLAYDSNEEFETENDFEAEHLHHGESGSTAKQENKVSVMDKIMVEMYEMETREKELQKKRHLYPPMAAATKQKEKSPNTSLESMDRPGQLTKKPIFGSRDDLVAYFGTNQEEEEEIEEKLAKKTTPRRDKSNAVKIPKVFKKMEAAAAGIIHKTKSFGIQESKTTTNYSVKTPASKIQNSREKPQQQARYEAEMQEQHRHQRSQKHQHNDVGAARAVERKKHTTRPMVNGFNHSSNATSRKSQILLKKQVRQESLLALDKLNDEPKQHQRTQAKVSFSTESVCMRNKD